MSQFKKGVRVSYRTPRGAQSGRGKIKQIRDTARGQWFDVEDENTKTVVSLRAANIVLAS